jgi:hypothetical protein
VIEKKAEREFGNESDEDVVYKGSAKVESMRRERLVPAKALRRKENQIGY